jgi:hypothetical protein
MSYIINSTNHSIFVNYSYYYYFFYILLKFTDCIVILHSVLNTQLMFYNLQDNMRDCALLVLKNNNNNNNNNKKLSKI